MSALIECIESNRSTFQVQYSRIQNIESQLMKELLENPSQLSKIDALSYSYVQHGNTATANFNINYHLDNSQLTFVVRDELELITAISIMLKSHKNRVKVIIDNRNSFADKDTIFSHICKLQDSSGVEFELSQRSLTRSCTYSFFNQSILICELSYQYFDDVRSSNSLSCVVAEHAISAQKSCRSEIDLVNYLMKWFRSNITYKNNNLESDHSAVGLIKNGTAVCQGIAVYAYLFLNFCGIKTRYVGGEGKGSDGWGPHAWNLVYIENRWTHIDYTFELESLKKSVFYTEQEFAKNHRWDTVTYSVAYSNRSRKVLETLQASIMLFIPNKAIFSVNGCIVYLPQVKEAVSIIDGTIMIALFEVLRLIGGSYALKSNKISLYLNGEKIVIERKFFTIKDGIWYLPIVQMQRIGFKLEVDKTVISIEMKRKRK